MNINRVNSEIKKQLSGILAESNIRDPRVKGLITVNDVVVDNDLEFAKVYVSILGANGEEETVIKGLNSAVPYFKAKLKDRVKLRALPSLSFHLDKSLDYAMHIEGILNKIKEKSE